MVARAAVLLALLYIMTRARLLANILPEQRIRVDASGDGHFGTSRTGHVHQGVDLLVEPGQEVRSPVSGRYIRTGYPYASDRRYRMMVLNGEGMEIRIMYAVPVVGIEPGSIIARGQVIGRAQGIADKYGPPMLHHLHVEARAIVGAGLLDPSRLLKITTA